MRGRVLVIAGSDSGGGAGIQADLKTVQALGGYATTAVTALTAQDTCGVHGVLPVPATFVRQQVDVVLADIGADAVKTGMLGTAAVIATVADALCGRSLPFVLDPVMLAKGGAPLLDPDALDALRALIPLATLLTPNLPEAEALLGHPIDDPAAAATDLLSLGATAVLLKGGHGDGPVLRDILAMPGATAVFENRRLDTPHTHGTGCTLASAVAVGLAQGLALRDAVARAIAYVHAAIAAAPGLGTGHGPLDHGIGAAGFRPPPSPPAAAGAG